MKMGAIRAPRHVWVDLGQVGDYDVNRGRNCLHHVWAPREVRNSNCIGAVDGEGSTPCINLLTSWRK